MTKNILWVVAAFGVLAAIAYFLQDNKKPAKQKITIGMVTFPGYAPLYLAKEKGLFEDIEIELQRIESIADLRAAMVSGNIDVYAATYDIFQNSQVNPPGIGFLAIDRSHGADGIMVSDKIKAVSDLKGQAIAVEPGLPPYFILQYVLHNEGMTLKDVTVKDMPSQDAGQAFLAGKIDAAGTYEPYLSKALAERKNSRLLFSSLNTNNLIIDFLFASEKLYKEHPEALQRLAEGWFKALKYLAQHEDESLAIMGKEFGVSAKDMKEFSTVVTWLDLVENKKLFDKDNSASAYRSFDTVSKVLQANQPSIIELHAVDKLKANIIENVKE